MADMNDVPFVQRLAIPAVCLLICFLAYSSQWLFATSLELAPGSLTRTESIVFNFLLFSLWLTYYRACRVHPGQYTLDSDKLTKSEPPSREQDESSSAATIAAQNPRWCRKCRGPKPARAHHCRHCNRCIPRMDHHCPWTGNCVSMTTFPHFLRFLIYTNLSLWTLAYFIYQRFSTIWKNRALPAYLGPSLPALVHLTLLSLTLFSTSLALGILLANTLKGWVLNQTMIEGWEIERHESVADRGAGRDWWKLTSPDGKPIRFEKVEFPYDIGFLANMSQAMGTSNVLMWLFPLAGSPTVAKDGQGVGWEWEENDLNDRKGMWPPLDPEKLRRPNKQTWKQRIQEEQRALKTYESPEAEIAAFKARQAADMKRWQGQNSRIIELGDGESDSYDMLDDGRADESEGEESNMIHFERGHDGEPGWTNSDGERLRDYGVYDDDDEDGVYDDDIPLVNTYNQDDEDVPLAELIRRRKVPLPLEQHAYE
jgi:palmitoyltransferase